MNVNATARLVSQVSFRIKKKIYTEICRQPKPLYAYEAKAGVRFDDDALATRDVDLLWDSRKRVKFFTTMARLDTSVIDVLRRADKTFERRAGQLETAQNADGYEVDFLRREAVGTDPHPVRLSADEEDLWVVQAKNAKLLLEAPRFDAVVV